MDKVTVIIPVYNRVNLALNAIWSVLRQTYPSIELIVVDDGSEQDMSMIDGLRHRFNESRMFFVHQSHRGPAAARNVGLGLVTPDTRYVAFLDADDYWANNKVENQAAMMKDNPRAVMSHTSYYITNGRSIVGLSHAGSFGGKIFPRMLFNCPITTSSVMIAHGITRKFRFRTDMECVEDIVAWAEIAKLGDVIGIDAFLTTITQDENSGSINKEKQLRGINNLIEYIKGDADIGWVTALRLLWRWNKIRGQLCRSRE